MKLTILSVSRGFDLYRKIGLVNWIYKEDDLRRGRIGNEEKEGEKMKKKICCALIMLLAVLPLAACGGGSSGAQAEAGLDQTKEKIQAIEDAQINITTESVIKGKDEEHTTTVKTESVVKEAAADKGAMDMDIRYKQSVNGTEQTAAVCIKDGKAYVDNGKEKIILDSPAMYSGFGNLAQNLVLGLDEDTLKKITKEEKNNQNIYQITVNDEKFAACLQKAAIGGEGEDKEKAQDEGQDKAAAAVKDVELQVVTDKADLIKSIRLSCVNQLSSGEEEETLEESYRLQAEFVSVNQGLTIDFPDFSKYKEAAAGGGEV